MQGVNIEEVITLLLSNGEDPSEVPTSHMLPVSFSASIAADSASSFSLFLSTPHT